MTPPHVAIILGSESDRAAMDDALKILTEFGVAHEVVVASAHRAPDLLDRYVRGAEDRGIRIFIGAAGGALAFMLAADSLRNGYAPGPIAMCEVASESGLRAAAIVGDIRRR